MKPNIKESLLCLALIAAAGYICLHVVCSSAPMWLKCVIIPGLLAVAFALVDKIYNELSLSPTPYQRLVWLTHYMLTGMGVLTILSVYELRGRYSAKTTLILLTSRMCWLQPRLKVLSEKTRLSMEYNQPGTITRVIEDRYIGQNAK